MKRFIYLTGVFALVLVVVGFISGKISAESFTYISIPGIIVTCLKMLLSQLVLMLSTLMIVPAVIIDLLLWIFSGMYFPLISSIIDAVWNDFIVAWFWQPATGSAILFTSIINLAASYFLLRRKKK